MEVYGAEQAIVDPTRPPDPSEHAQESTGSWELTGIIISSTRRLAVINGKTVRVGDILQGGNKVTSIETNTVQLDGPGGKIILNLLENPVKK